ncbi:MAG TPA: N-acetylmuramoyl-L-alanine amidase [Thermoanaerobacterales bacterium]|jgi:N-acetylmuramoyl-L-alanine amidase|nr:N-acetylmuramoyl-L-alanine amidase [Thermoanaerobacterales bacterium]
MKPEITNLYVQTSDYSTLVVESTRAFSYTIHRAPDHLYVIFLDARLLMAPDIIWVYDGIVNKIEVKQKEDKTLVYAYLAYPSSYSTTLDQGMPVKLKMFFDRSFIKNLLKDKVIVIDPGHGGKDVGFLGYINLLEKNVVLDIAHYLKRGLNNHGAHAVITRERDISIGFDQRIQVATLLEADMFISLHTNWDLDKRINGAKGTYKGVGAQFLCSSIIEEIGKKLRLSNLGIKRNEIQNFLPRNHHINSIPYVNIEVCTISNPVEEGWLRSPVFKERMAIAIINGIVRYLSQHNMVMTAP